MHKKQPHEIIREIVQKYFKKMCSFLYKSTKKLLLSCLF